VHSNSLTPVHNGSPSSMHSNSHKEGQYKLTGYSLKGSKSHIPVSN